jgi:hypothetical protein
MTQVALRGLTNALRTSADCFFKKNINMRRGARLSTQEIDGAAELCMAPFVISSISRMVLTSQFFGLFAVMEK